MIRLSVITPVFNGAKYIRKCLENVAQQATVEIEHLVLDGASTDGTVEFVAEFALKNPHVRLISEKDKGQSDAMNKGIELAKGAILGFLNVDDYYEPYVLPRVLEIFKDLPEPSFVCGNLNIWNADGSFRHFNKPDRISLVELASCCFEWPYNPSAYFYHKSLHQFTGQYNVENHFCMDYEFIMEAAKHLNLRHVDELWGNFFMAEGSKTQVMHSEEQEIAFQAGQNIRDKAIEAFGDSEKNELNLLLAQNPVLYPTEEPKKEMPVLKKFRMKVKALAKKILGT
jgi:glycosyltransferase involved in cell wall biosynthesis